MTGAVRSSFSSISIGRVLLISALIALSTLDARIVTSQRRPVSNQKKSSVLTAEEIAKKILPSVVLIACEDDRGNKSIGSGFFVRSGRELLIVTAYHVIQGMIRGTWRNVSNSKNSAVIDSVLDYDEQSDLALLRPNPYESVASPASDLHPLTLASSAPIRPGQTVYALGNPEGLTGTISQGIISAAPRKFADGTRVQLTAPISPGSSGGPVVNNSGEVIGIAESSLVEGQNLNFAVPASFLFRLLNKVDPNAAQLPGSPLDPGLEATPANTQTDQKGQSDSPTCFNLYGVHDWTGTESVYGSPTEIRLHLAIDRDGISGTLRYTDGKTYDLAGSCVSGIVVLKYGNYQSSDPWIATLTGSVDQWHVFTGKAFIKSRSGSTTTATWILRQAR